MRGGAIPPGSTLVMPWSGPGVAVHYRPDPVRNRYILAADVLLIAFCAFASFALRFDFVGLSDYYAPFRWYLVAALVVKPTVFHLFGLYRRYWKYASVWDLVLVAIDPDRLPVPLRWAPARGGDLFPHLYAPLPTAASLWITPLPLGPDGVPVLPATVATSP